MMKNAKAKRNSKVSKNKQARGSDSSDLSMGAFASVENSIARQKTAS
jgi:hypothetical protein